MSYLLSHNLPRGFLPELVHTTCDDSDTFRRVRQLMFWVTLNGNDNQEFRTLSWKKIKFQDKWWFVVYQEDNKFSNRLRALYICMSKCSLVYLHKKKNDVTRENSIFWHCFPSLCRCSSQCCRVWIDWSTVCPWTGMTTGIRSLSSRSCVKSRVATHALYVDWWVGKEDP